MNKSLNEEYLQFLDKLNLTNANMYMNATNALVLEFDLPRIIANEIVKEWFEYKEIRYQLLNESN